MIFNQPTFLIRLFCIIIVRNGGSLKIPCCMLCRADKKFNWVVGVILLVSFDLDLHSISLKDAIEMYIERYILLLTGQSSSKLSPFLPIYQLIHEQAVGLIFPPFKQASAGQLLFMIEMTVNEHFIIGDIRCWTDCGLEGGTARDVFFADSASSNPQSTL